MLPRFSLSMTPGLVMGMTASGGGDDDKFPIAQGLLCLIGIAAFFNFAWQREIGKGHRSK